LIPDVERDWNERVKNDDVGEEGHDADDGCSAGRVGLVVTSADDAARYEVLPWQNRLKLDAVAVLPDPGTDGAHQTQAHQEQEYLQSPVHCLNSLLPPKKKTD